MSFKKTFLFPVLILSIGLVAALAIVKSKPEPQRQITEAPDPAVRVVEARAGSITLTVESQGTVRPRTESQLVAQVKGEIVEVSQNFAEGGFFERGDLLLRIDPRDFELAVSQAAAQLALTHLRLEQEQAQAVVAREEWESLGEGEASALALHEPQLAEARAAVKAAESSLELARLNLDRTEIRARYAGRVRSKHADLGQFVRDGFVLGSLFSIDHAEIRLPVAQDQLAYLDISLDGSASNSSKVMLSAKLGGDTVEWSARIVRTAGEIDPRSRMFSLIAQVEDPYGRNSENAVLPVGLFVNARIEGRLIEDVVTVPRSALREGGRVLVVEEGNRLRYRAVEVLRLQDDTVLISSGIKDGDLICISQLDAVVDGMRVEPLLETPDGQVVDPS
jgi:RND family efflux transporter MFP subunit